MMRVWLLAALLACTGRAAPRELYCTGGTHPVIASGRAVGCQR